MPFRQRDALGAAWLDGSDLVSVVTVGRSFRKRC